MAIQFGNSVEKRQTRRQAKNPGWSSMQRILVQVKVSRGVGNEPLIHEARMISTDFNSFGIRLFLNEPIPAGAGVMVTFSYPSQFFIQGQLQWCKLQETHSSVFSNVNYRYRGEILFTQGSEEERKRIQGFVDQVTGKNAISLPLEEAKAA